MALHAEIEHLPERFLASASGELCRAVIDKNSIGGTLPIQTLIVLSDKNYI